MGGRGGAKPRKIAMGMNRIISTLVISAIILPGPQLVGCVRVLTSNYTIIPVSFLLWCPAIGLSPIN